MSAVDSQLNAARLFQMLGVPSDAVFQQLNGIKQQASSLTTMIDRFQQSAGAFGGGNIASLAASGGLPGSMQVGLPTPGPIPGFSGGGQPADFANLYGSMAGAGNLGARSQAIKLERFLRGAPFAKAHLERMLGGSITADGVEDGRMQVQRQPGAFGQLGLQPGAGQGQQAGLPAGLPGALSALNNIGYGAQQGGYQGANPFMGMVAGGLNNALANPMQTPNFGGGQPQGLGNWFAGPQPIGVPANGGAMGGGFPAGGGLGGLGAGLGALGGAGGGFGGAQANAAGGGGGIMTDPSMTVEDQVVALLMKISQGFDKQIKAQADKVNQLQQQQGGGKGGQGGGGKGGEGGPSIDVESMKLKRLVDKRGQMFDMLRQVIDKYNETSKNMISRIA